MAEVLRHHDVVITWYNMCLLKYNDDNDYRIVREVFVAILMAAVSILVGVGSPCK